MGIKENEYWGSPAPIIENKTHLELDFGLRGAYMRFKAIVMPKIASLDNVRGLSYALTGLYFSEKLKSKHPTFMAHAIEGLANKIQWEKNGKESTGVTGARNFSLSKWDKDSIVKHYPKTGTMRQRAATAIGDLGFELAYGGRYSAMVLKPEGINIVRAFLASIDEDELEKYLNGESYKREKLEKMTIKYSCEGERAAVRKYLQSESRLKELCALVDNLPSGEWLSSKFEELDDDLHKNDIRTLNAFIVFRDAVRNIYIWLAEDGRTSQQLTELVKDKEIGSLINDAKNKREDLLQKQKQSQQSNMTDRQLGTICRIISQDDNFNILKEVIELDNSQIHLDDKKRIIKGGLWKPMSKYSTEAKDIDQVQRLYKEAYDKR